MSHVLPGKRLQGARTAAGLSVRHVANQLKMSVSYVEALEADDYERLPQAAFVKGYLRNYARLVGMPADDVANMFEQVVAEDAADKNVASAAVTQTALSSSSLLNMQWLLYGAALIAVLLLLWLSFGNSEQGAVVETAERPDQLTSLVEISSPNITDSSSSDGDSQGVVESSDADVDVVSASEESRFVETGAIEETAAPAQPVKLDMLSVTFSDVCWLKVDDAKGDTVFTGQRSAERSLRVEGQSPFRITLGNAAAVAAVSVNDEPVPVPSVAPGRVITLRTP